MVISLEGLIHPIMGSHAYAYVYGHNRIPKIIRAPEGNWGEGIQPYIYEITISPNPARSVTELRHNLPSFDLDREFLIQDWNGNIVRRISVANDQSSVSIDVSSLADGNYIASILTRGVTRASAQMIVAK